MRNSNLAGFGGSLTRPRQETKSSDVSDWIPIEEEEITCNAKHGEDRDDDGLDDEGCQLFEGLLVHLVVHLVS